MEDFIRKQTPEDESGLRDAFTEEDEFGAEDFDEEDVEDVAFDRHDDVDEY